MDINRDETNAYMKYKSKIDEIWQDQINAGGMFGRATLKEVFGAFKGLKERIEVDTDLSQEYKNELLGIIIEKMGLAKDREDEILKAESDWSNEKNNACRGLLARYRKMPFEEQERYSTLNRKMESGYNLFFTLEELENMFKPGMNFEEMEKRLSEMYPIISRDFKEIFEKEKKSTEKSDD